MKENADPVRVSAEKVNLFLRVLVLPVMQRADLNVLLVPVSAVMVRTAGRLQVNLNVITDFIPLVNSIPIVSSTRI
jgi:hypothetical protein